MKKQHFVIDARIRRSSTGRYVDRLIEHLQNIDDFHRYTILLQPDDHWKPQAKNFTALPCPYPQFSLNPLHQIGFAVQLYRLKPDMVHFSMTQQPLIYFGNIVTTTHDTTMYHFVRRGTTSLPIYKLKINLYKFLVWWSHLKSKRIIVPTKTVAKEFIERQPFVKNKIAVTYEASEPPLKNKSLRPPDVPADSQFIMYVGTAFPHKNLPLLVDALPKIVKKHPNINLVLAGKTEKHYLELHDYAAKSPAGNHIIFTGFVPDESLKWLFEHAQAYVFPSLSEGFGLPPLEAMQHGTPVICSKASVMPEVYADAAYYFDPIDPDDCADKINQVLDSKKLRDLLTKNGYAQVAKYSWRKMAEETLTIYKSTIK